MIILVAQALLSARLMKIAPIPSGDEGLYIYSGHQLIYEFWHGGGSPYYETYFSGAPVIYPVLAAMADHVGGLAAVRLMSLEFMLFATALLFATARRLLGYWPAITAAGLFAGFASTQDIGVYGTFDAMSLALTGLAAYCAVRARAGSAHEGSWLLCVPAALLLANATKYVTIAFDPVVIALASYSCLRRGWRSAGQRFVIVSLTTSCLLAIAAFVAGGAYIHGALYTTFARNSSSQALLGGSALMPARAILSEARGSIGILIAAGLAATILALLMGDRRRAILFLIMVGAGLLITAAALRLHTDQSMSKHNAFGMWFTCIAAGGIVTYLSVRRSRVIRAVTVMSSAFAIVLAGWHFMPLAVTTYEARPDPSIIAASVFLRPYLRHPGRFLVGGLAEDAILYSANPGLPWWRNNDDQYIKFPIPGRGGDPHGQHPGQVCDSIGPGCVYLEGVAGFRAAIQAHWFVLISLVGGHGATPQDEAIAQTVQHTAGYVLLTNVGGAPTWIYVPAYKN